MASRKRGLGALTVGGLLVLVPLPSCFMFRPTKPPLLEAGRILVMLPVGLALLPFVLVANLVAPETTDRLLNPEKARYAHLFIPYDAYDQLSCVILDSEPPGARVRSEGSSPSRTAFRPVPIERQALTGAQSEKSHRLDPLRGEVETPVVLLLETSAIVSLAPVFHFTFTWPDGGSRTLFLYGEEGVGVGTDGTYQYTTWFGRERPGESCTQWERPSTASTASILVIHRPVVGAASRPTR
ncbi:MAG TPA: hypothetical protein VFI25_12385 [Planctomycetota bacterium]|jgi:hypothetical protein|nr:hypothetical protein [Planctomycetota bacterium]